QAGAALGGALVDPDGEQADLAGEVRAILFALGENQTDHLGVVVDHPLHIGRFERGVADAPGLDHRLSPNLCLVFALGFALAGINHCVRGETRPLVLSFRTAASRPRNDQDTLAKPRGSRFGRGPNLKGEEAMAKSAGYKLATYQANDGPRAGLVIEDKVFDAAALTRKPAYASV